MQNLKLTVFCILIIVTSSCYNNKDKIDPLYKSDPDGRYGDKITLTTFNNLEELFNSPDQYLGNEVLITGEITEVCPMRGCWIDIKDTHTNHNIRIKVIDGEIVFPLSAKGKYADIQGMFTKLEFSEDQARQWKIHLAEEKGIILKPEEVQINPSDLFEYRINGESANIYTYGCK